MPTQVPPAFDDDVEHAMVRVLEAERMARENLAEAQAEAERIAEDARAAVRATAEQARRRIARLHDAFERRLQVELEALAVQARALPAHDEPDADDLARLDLALQRLAARLTQEAMP